MERSSCDNFTLKKEAPEGPLFTPHIRVICDAEMPNDEPTPITTLKMKLWPLMAHRLELRTTGEERVNPQLISVVSASTTRPINIDSTIMHSKYASRDDASTSMTAEDLADITKSTEKELNIQKNSKDLFNKEQSNKEELKLYDIIKLMLPTMDERILGKCDSHEDKKSLIVSSVTEEEPKVTPTLDPDTHKDTEDTSVPKSPPPSPKSQQIRYLTNQILILKAQKIKLEEEKHIVEAALLKAQPSYQDTNRNKRNPTFNFKTILLEIIEEGNSFKPVAQTTREADGTSTTTIPEDCDQLTILGEIITPEELNLKFLRSLPTEWGIHVVVWRNKSDLGSISFDDLYNNFKIVELEVKRSVTSSSNSGSHNLAFVSVYAYLATQPNGSQVVHEDLDQIHEDDLNEMDLKWQLALLKCRNPKSQENRSRNQDSSRRTMNVKEASPKAMLAIDVERLKKEKEENQFKIDNYENASKSLEQLIANQISDNNKKGLGYNVNLEFEGYGVKVTKSASEMSLRRSKENFRAPISERLFPDCDEDKTINMLVDKKYPLKKKILKKMINLKIEAEEESDMASELIKFIKSQIAEQS
ncbi:hypothetical protein Tco_1378710 [Tanacetum coccineum]